MATIKYYLREGLLPPGERTAVNQAVYGQRHLHRLRLIRVLRTVGDLPIATIREILEAAGDDRLPVHDLLGIAHRAMGPAAPADSGAELAAARSQVDAFLDRLGWRVSADAPARTTLARTLISLRRLGHDADPNSFVEYARAAERIAAWELAHVAAADTREQQVEQVVVGAVVYETALVALRRLAQEHHSALRFSDRTT